MNPTPDPALSQLFNGKWALLYAATGERRSSRVGGGALQAILDTSYDSVRKLLPALAGVGGGDSKSFQIVDLASGRVDNTVDLQPPIGPKVHILVEGSVARSDTDPGVRAQVRATRLLTTAPSSSRTPHKGSLCSRTLDTESYMSNREAPAGDIRELHCPPGGGARGHNPPSEACGRD